MTVSLSFFMFQQWFGNVWFNKTWNGPWKISCVVQVRLAAFVFLDHFVKIAKCDLNLQNRNSRKCSTVWRSCKSIFETLGFVLSNHEKPIQNQWSEEAKGKQAKSRFRTFNLHQFRFQTHFPQCEWGNPFRVMSLPWKLSKLLRFTRVHIRHSFLWL